MENNQTSPFAWEDLERAAEDAGLQQEMQSELPAAYDRFRKEYGDKIDQEPETLRWVYVRSSPESWAAKAGREGWLVGDDATQTPLAFLWTMIA